MFLLRQQITKQQMIKTVFSWWFSLKTKKQRNKEKKKLREMNWNYYNKQVYGKTQDSQLVRNEMACIIFFIFFNTFGICVYSRYKFMLSVVIRNHFFLSKLLEKRRKRMAKKCRFDLCENFLLYVCAFRNYIRSRLDVYNNRIRWIIRTGLLLSNVALYT